MRTFFTKSPANRTPAIRTAAILATAGISLVGIGTVNADETDDNISAVTSTVPPAPTTVAAAPTTAAGAATTVAAAPTTAAGAATTVAAAPTTAAGAPTTVAGAPAAGLPAAATVQQFREVLTPAVGPTTDLPGELIPFGVTPPAGIPTPEGSEIDNFDIYYYPDVEDPSRSYYDSTIVFTSTVPAADLVTLYQTQMVAAGFVQTGDQVTNEDDRQVRFLVYSNPNSAYSNAEIAVGVVDADTDFAQIEITDALDPAVMTAFSSWPTGLPLTDQATEIRSARLAVDSFGGDYTASVSTDWQLPIAEADARAQLEAAIPTSPYTEDTSFESETSIYLEGGEFTDLSVSIGESFPEGTSYYSVRGTFDIQL